MADDDRQSQHFIREVDEELRRDQLKALWDRFAPLIIGVCVLVVAVTAGYRGWIWWQERQAAQAGDRFTAALEEIESGDKAKGEADLAAIAAEGGSGYAILAQLRLAGIKAAAGASDEAIALYNEVAADSDASEPTRALANIRAAILMLDTGDLAGARERAAALDVAGNPWRHVAREVLGLAAYKSGELAEARTYFSALQEDAETPADLWSRAELMISLVDGQIPAPTAEATEAPPEGPSEEPTGAVDEAEGDDGAAETPPEAAPAAPEPSAAPEIDRAPAEEIPPQ